MTKFFRVTQSRALNLDRVGDMQFFAAQPAIGTTARLVFHDATGLTIVAIDGPEAARLWLELTEPHEE